MDQDTGTTIMVVGDDSSFCYLMRHYAKKSMHRIVFAYLGEEALALARREKPAVVVLEVGRPGTMGWGVLRALRADQVKYDVPVVLCFWRDEEEQEPEEGEDVYLRKLILYEDFLAALTDIGE